MLIEENLTGRRLETWDVYQVASDSSARARHLRAVAFVDVNASGDLMKFAETVANNRGAPINVFATVAEAESGGSREKRADGGGRLRGAVEFSVRESRRAEFESCYGPAGDWARLFSQAPGFIGTELLRDRADPLRHVTIDRWASIEDWRAFRARFAAEYQRLRPRSATLTARGCRSANTRPQARRRALMPAARYPIAGGCDCRAVRYPHDDRAALRALLSLPAGAKRESGASLRARNAMIGDRSRDAARGARGECRRALGERQGQDPCAARPAASALCQSLRGRRHAAFRSSASARSTTPTCSRHDIHIFHVVEAWPPGSSCPGARPRCPG